MKGKLYRCFSNNLKKYLMEKGHRYELIAKDITSDKTMWIFIINSQLKDDIHKWELQSPKRK